MTGPALRGPFLTRREAARRAGVSPEAVVRRPDLLRLGGRHLEEVYFAFQFDESGVRPELARLVQRLRRDHEDIDVCHWLVEPHEGLGLATPLEWLSASGSEETLTRCAADSGPVGPPAIPTPAPDVEPAWRHSPGAPRHSRPRRLVMRPAAWSGI